MGSLSGNGGDIYEEPRRMVNVCCLWEVRWRGLGGGMLSMKGTKYKLWLSGRGDVVDDVGVMVKEELCV